MPVLPAPDEWAALTPQPGSPVWRAFNDTRMLFTSGYATLLQVSHPTVGAGVHQYSSFTKDPWGRLWRTLDYVHGTIYGGPELAGTIGARVRNMHRTIKGTKPDGSRYHAMEPEAFAWVHATLAGAIVEGHRRFARAMTPAQVEAFWTQWLDVGRLIGVRPGDLPEDWAGFTAYFERMVDEELEWTAAVDEVMDMLSRPTPPQIPGLGPGAWRLVSLPLAMQQRVVTTGLLGPELRERLGLSYSRADERAFRLISAAARASSPLIRGPLAEFGPRYVRARREALARGDVASAPPAAREPVAA